MWNFRRSPIAVSVLSLGLGMVLAPLPALAGGHSLFADSLIATGAAGSASALADENGDTSWVSDYRVSGFHVASQMAFDRQEMARVLFGDEVSYLGSFDLSHDSGLHLGLSGASADASPLRQRMTGDVAPQMGVGAGFRTMILEGLGLDMGAVRHFSSHPDLSDSYTQFYLGGETRWFNAQLSFSGDVAVDGTPGRLYRADMGMKLPRAMSLDVGAGLFAASPTQTSDTPSQVNDWRIGVRGQVVGMDMGLSYEDSRLGVAGEDATTTTEERVLFHLSTQF
ncbi:MAG: hypothetical protein H7831_12585 [Magnetococcus sp. WYHC-3]